MGAGQAPAAGCRGLKSKPTFYRHAGFTQASSFSSLLANSFYARALRAGAEFPVPSRASAEAAIGCSLDLGMQRVTRLGRNENGLR